MNHYIQFINESKQRRLAIMAEYEKRKNEPGIVRKLSEANGVTTQAIYYMMKVSKRDGTGKRGKKQKD